MPKTEILLLAHEKLKQTFVFNVDVKISTQGSTVSVENKDWDFPVNTD